MSSLAIIAAVFPAVTVLPLVSSVMVSAWSFHPVLPRLILIPTALFLLMACVHSCLQGIQGFQPAVSHFSGSLYGSCYVSCRIIYMIPIFFLP